MWRNVNTFNPFNNKHCKQYTFFNFNIFYRHLHCTGHIGNFVIASEEAIAKGIRRIVALTGPEATKALKKAAVLQNILDQLQTTIVSDKTNVNIKEQVKKIVELTDDISHAVISSWRKVHIFLHYFILQS